MVSPSAEYHTLEVRLQARLPFTKHLSLKPHSSRKDDLPAGRTLLVAGIPVTISANDLVELFSAFGNVSSLAVHPSKVITLWNLKSLIPPCFHMTTMPLLFGNMQLPANNANDIT